MYYRMSSNYIILLYEYLSRKILKVRVNMEEWILNYWIEIVFGLICTGFGIGFKSIFKRIKDQKLESDAIKLGIQALLRGN